MSPETGDLLEELARRGGEVTTQVIPGGCETTNLDEEAPVWRKLPGDRTPVELALPGQNVPRVCQHGASDVMVEAMVALIEDVPPRWEVRLKAICRCGITFAVAREGRAPRDGSPGTVLVLTPLPCDTGGTPPPS